MEISATKLIKESEITLNDIGNTVYDQDRQSSQDLNQLACCLKDAIFSKYISNYLLEKTDKMWILYEKRIDKFLREKRLDISCHQIRPRATVKLEEIVQDQQKNIVACERDIKILCSSRKRLRNDEKYSIRLQSTQRTATSGNSIHVPKTPRCIDRYKVINDAYEFNLTDSK